MTTYIGKSDPAAALRVELIVVLYAPKIGQWCSILHSQADASRAVDLGYPEGTHLAGGECACAFTRKCASEHQVGLLELLATHGPLVIAPEHLMMSTIAVIVPEHLTMATIALIVPERLMMKTIVVIAPEHRERCPLCGAPNVEVVYDTSTGTALEQPVVVHCLEGLRSLEF
jgi:hypothetical protein